MPAPSRRLRAGLSFIGLVAALSTALAAFIFFADLWARARFPMQDAQIVVANALADNRAADPAVFRSFALEVGLPVLAVLVFYLFILIVSHRAIFTARIGRRVRRQKRLHTAILFLPLLMLLSSSFYLWKTIPVAEYLEVAEAVSTPVEEEDKGFLETWYVDPATANISFPEKKRNLILVFLESMETSFQDREAGGWFDENLIPGLSALAKEHVNFTHEDAASGRIGGGIDVTGTGWTIAGIVGKTMGIPFVPQGEENPEGLETFIPRAVSLFDILADAGYRQRFICGSDIRFASRDAFFATHGKVETRDWRWYRGKGKLPSPDYGVFWGFEDRHLYRFAREELDEMAAGEGPFMFSMLTVDTHFPQGYVCPECGQEHTKSRLDRYKDVLLCADRQASDFLDWCAQQPWYQDTTIVVLGDHLFMTSERFNVFENPAALIPLHRVKDAVDRTSHFRRRWYNLFVNSAVLPVKRHDRTFSSFDIYPSILEAAGAQIEGHALGFGRSLFADVQTAPESMDESDFNLELLRAAPLFYETPPKETMPHGNEAAPPANSP